MSCPWSCTDINQVPYEVVDDLEAAIRDFVEFYNYRRYHQALRVVQVLALCQQAGLVKLGHVALDGTKVKANASKHKAMSYQRMKEKAAQLAAEVAVGPPQRQVC